MDAFVYRYKEYDRDSAHYMDLAKLGTQNTFGPNFACGLEKFATSVKPSYSQIETALSEEQWNRLCQNGLEQDMVDTLLSSEGKAFEQKIRQSEKDLICQFHGISMADAERCVAEYPGPDAFFDNGIVMSVFDSFDEAVEEKAWNWGTDDIEMVRDRLEEDRDIMRLSNGKVVEFGE